MPLAKLAARWSHVAGKRHFGALFCRVTGFDLAPTIALLELPDGADAFPGHLLRLWPSVSIPAFSYTQSGSFRTPPVGGRLAADVGSS